MMTLRRVRHAGLVAVLAAIVTYSTVQGADSKYLPNDTEIVFTINVQQILESELLKANKDAVDQAKMALENEVGDNPAMKYLKSAGFDIFRDLNSITIAGDGGKEPTAFIIHGTFNPAKLAATAETAAKENPDAIKISKIGGQNVYEFTPPGDKKGFASLVGDKILIATSTSAGLTDALERLAGSKQSSLKKEFAVLLDTVNDKQSMSFVATGAALAKLVQGGQVPNGEAAALALQNIDGLSGALTVGKEVQFQLGLNAKNEAGAKKMAQDGSGMLLGVQFLVNQQAKKDEKFAPVVDIVKTLRITNQGSNVLLRGTISLDVIAKLMKNIPQ